MRKKIIGIYAVTNIQNGKQYVGQSRDIMRRWWDHRSKSQHPQKPEDYNKKLYKKMREYGLESFTLTILEECSLDELDEKETYWIQKLDTFENGYNCSLGGKHSSPLSVHKGENHPKARFTNEDVMFCRQLYKNGCSSSDIYNLYYSNGCYPNYSSFQKMWHGTTWKHIMPEVFENNPRPRQKLTIETIKEIKNKFKDGWTCAQVFHYFDEKFSRTTINDIYHGRRYKDIVC